MESVERSEGRILRRLGTAGEVAALTATLLHGATPAPALAQTAEALQPNFLAGYVVNDNGRSIGATQLDVRLPELSCGRQLSYVSVWAGVGNPNALEEVGALGTCQNDASSWRAFYDSYPKRTVIIPKEDLKAGQTVEFSVQLEGNGNVVYRVKDGTQSVKIDSHCGNSACLTLSNTGDALVENPPMHELTSPPESYPLPEWEPAFFLSNVVASAASSPNKFVSFTELNRYSEEMAADNGQPEAITEPLTRQDTFKISRFAPPTTKKSAALAK